jgi:cob(I)alamin adenosyltransferase
MSKFYTARGDDGYTGILGQGRLPKYAPIVAAYGEVDEASSFLGLARALTAVPAHRELVRALQRDLYHLMAELAAAKEHAERFRYIDRARVAWLNERIEELGRGLEMPEEFILPGDTPAAAAFDLARTVVRRAERRLAQLVHQGVVENKQLLVYLNRLSSMCFVLELREILSAGAGGPTLARGEPG